VNTHLRSGIGPRLRMTCRARPIVLRALPLAASSRVQTPGRQRHAPAPRHKMFALR
jgi:hypothetical protein